jgi:catechol 2,3-dioxygenase-like lactoylglutathione lyase family enzyme
MKIQKVDFVGIPTADMERAQRFYGEVLGLRRDEHSESEFWAGETCISLWMPSWAGQEFVPQELSMPALRVEDVAAARAELESKGVEFQGEIFDSGVCHMAFFKDADGNGLMLHRRYAPYEGTEA